MHRTVVKERAESRDRLSPAETFVLIAAAVWTGYVALTCLRLVGGAAEVLATSWPYLAFAPVLVAGAVLGHVAKRGVLPLVVSLLVVAPALVLLLGVPSYVNALAAAGVQLVALGALILEGSVGAGVRGLRGAPMVRTRDPGDVALGGWDRAQIAWRRQLVQVIGACIAVLGAVLATNAKAGVATLAVVLLAAALTAWGRLHLSRRTIVGLGLGAVGLAALLVVVLGVVSRWPSWMTGPQSLSSARHALWRDALTLFAQNPVLGGGPGAFFEWSGVAQHNPLLYAAHSSVLQVASELGAVGVILFAAMLVSGTLLAAQRGRGRALIGVAAWSALAVHSMIDHLYEFPMVVLLAGIVIGWAGARPVRRAASSATPRS